MGQPYVGEIRMFAGNFAPAGWMLCQGQLLPISQYETLFNLIGTTYGGDGQSTFALPNLQSRVPIHWGTGGGGTYVISQMAGEEQVTLTVNQIPGHTHVPQANSGTGTQTSPAGNVWASSANFPYSPNAPTAAMVSQAVQSTGGSQPHDNMVPFLAINFIISLFGVFPTQN
jgi:microcystin-dependent protein